MRASADPARDVEVLALRHEVRVLRRAAKRPRWDYQRIAGELRKLGHSISATTVRTILKRRGESPAPRRDSAGRRS